MSLFRNLIQLSTSKSKPLLQNPNFLFTSLSHFTTDTPTRYAGLEPTKGDEKPRVVVLGSGWAGCRLMKGIDTDLYDVVCVSPRNHMVFTPLLASTCVGTLEFRSVAEPIGRIQPAISKAPGSYFFLANCSPKAEAESPSQAAVLAQVDGNDASENSVIYPYERLKVNSSDPVTDIDVTKREVYLCDDEFREKFGMRRKAFYELPKWRQNKLKISLHLF
ncbi:hypothetical protein NC652_022998 [Populus alba x Populus x berolinensis]|nr:hypothetical protein NC652_022998 [Populus alba x Populus x berolinensis]